MLLIFSYSTFPYAPRKCSTSLLPYLFFSLHEKSFVPQCLSSIAFGNIFVPLFSVCVGVFIPVTHSLLSPKLLLCAERLLTSLGLGIESDLRRTKDHPTCSIRTLQDAVEYDKQKQSLSFTPTT